MATRTKSDSSSVYDMLPSPAAGPLQLARLQAGMSQQELAERAGVDRTMVSAYEHDRRQPTLPTLLKLLKAAGFELRMHLEPYDDHDDVLASREAKRTPAERAAWEAGQRKRLASLTPAPAKKRVRR
jgi:transcriptional regulator with XRE-family HTH domain